MIRDLCLFLIFSTLYGFSTWASIKIIDRYNTRNTMGAACAVGIMFGGVVPFAGMLLGFLPLAGLLMVLVAYYDLGFVRSFLTVIVMGIVLNGVGSVLWSDDSVITDDTTAIIWGAVFAAGLIATYVLRKRGIIASTPEQRYERLESKRRNQAMPTARAKRLPESKPAAHAPMLAAPAPDVAAAPAPAPAPPTSPARAVEPPPAPTSFEDGPKFLT